MQIRSPLRIQMDVIFALLMREIKTRFGSFRLGYTWALLEPLSIVLIFCLIFGLRGRNVFGGLDVPIFVLTGFVPYNLFINTLNECRGGCRANKGLFGFRQVKPIDTFITRSFLEISIYATSFFILTFLFQWLGYNAFPYNFVQVVSASTLLWLYAIGIGIIFAVLSTFSAEVDKIIPLLLRPLIFISGVFFPLSIFDESYRWIIALNPIIHAIELIRQGWTPNYPASEANFIYLGTCTVSSLALGMLCYRLNWRRLISPN